MSVEIIPEFTKEYLPFLEGSGDSKHFIIQNGELLCVRKSCEGCQYSAECEFEEAKAYIDPIPPARRGVGLEETPFLQLYLKPAVSLEEIPEELLQGAREESLEECNNHWMLQDWRATSFKIFKGGIRLYGVSKTEFEHTPYAQYFGLIGGFEPASRPVSLDFSAVEPRCSTLAPLSVGMPPVAKWRAVFEGKPSIIYKLVEIASEAPKPYYLYEREGRTYCYLAGELDKVNYEGQCAKCPLAEACSTKQNFYKNLPGDWHGLNRRALYGLSKLKDIPKDADGNYLPRNDDEKYLLKELRDIAKIVGLALNYGGSAWTVSRNMNESVEQAQEKIDAFFAELPDLSQYMARAKRNALTTGFVVNLFGRSRSVQEDIAKGRSGIGYAERTALNHPIQSTSADWMKLAMIRVSDYIKEKGLDPLWGDEIPLVIDPKETTYLDIILTMLASVHDEVVYLMLDEMIESLVPEVYHTMQIHDVIKHHGVGYTLEMDTEYDDTRSWTSTKKMDQAKVYLLKYLDGVEGKGGKKLASDRTHNGYTIPFEKLTRPLIDRLQSYSNELHPEAKTFILAVVRDTQLYKHEKVFPQEYLEQLAIEFSVTLSPVHID